MFDDDNDDDDDDDDEVKCVVWVCYPDFLTREEEVEDVPIDLENWMKRETTDCLLCIR